MGHQRRTIKGATCLLLSLFVILCAINDEVSCGRFRSKFRFWGRSYSRSHRSRHSRRLGSLFSRPGGQSHHGGSHSISEPAGLGHLESSSHGASGPPVRSTYNHATNTHPHSSSGSISEHPISKSPSYGVREPVGPPPGAPFSIHPPPYTPHSPGIPPPAYNPAHNPAGYGPPPAYNPAHNPVGYGPPPAYSPSKNPADYGHQPTYGGGAYPQQHPGGYGQPTYLHPGKPGVTINNMVTNNHFVGGGSGYSSPTYHYSSNDVGSDTLGFYLGYSLGKVTKPTYHYHSSFYNGYTPRYDHYEVHHYYHNRDSVPAHSTIEPNAIVGCVGDSGTICPSGTTSLCTNNGAILCVASATSTVPCTDGNCVKTVVPCVNNAGNCEVGKNTTITIPCISTAKVPGNVTYVNNTIIVNHTTIINNKGSSGNGTITGTNMLSSSSDILVHYNSVSLRDFAQRALSSFENLTNSTTEKPTTLPPTTEGTRNKSEAPAEMVNNFCVTILALPAERKPTEQEEIVKKGTGMFSKFLVRAVGAK